MKLNFKPIDPADRPKVIALTVVAVIVLGISGVQVFSYNSAESAMLANIKQADAKKAAAKDGAGAGAAGAAGLPAAAPAGGDASTVLAALSPSVLAAPVGGKDPFVRSGIFAERPKPTPTPAPPPAPTAPPLPGVGKNGLASLYGPPPQFDSGSPRGPVVLAAPPPPAVTVTGVVLGDQGTPEQPSVAVIEAPGANGAAARRFVSVGDAVGNGFVVAEVRRDGVVLRDGKRHVTLKMETVSGSKR